MKTETVDLVILVPMAGDRFSWSKGDRVPVEKAEAARLIKAEYAVQAPPLEKAAKAAGGTRA